MGYSDVKYVAGHNTAIQSKGSSCAERVLHELSRMEETDDVGASEATAGMYSTLQFKGKSFAYDIDIPARSHSLRYRGYKPPKARKDLVTRQDFSRSSEVS